MPIPPADYAVPSSTGNGTLANHRSQSQKRKRSRAGYQVEQTTSAANILTKHQQPPEQPLAPPIKLRRVHDGRRVEQPTQEQEPMETEPAITACTVSLPVAVFGAPPENPQPTSGKILATTSETTPTPVRENIEPMEDDNPAQIPPAQIPPAQIPSEVLSKFLPEHQEALREHLINNNLEVRQDLKTHLKTHLKKVVQNAEKLLKLLRERQIELSKNRSKPPFPTLFSRLKVFSITEKPELFSTYFAKVSVFFSAVNTNQIKNTGCLTCMLLKKSQIRGFTEQSEEVIRFIASQLFLKQIASMYSGKGFPPGKEVEIFLSIPCLKQGWQPGCDEAVRDKPIDRELLIRISSMNSSRGFPSGEQVAAFMTIPCLKEGWQQGNDEAVQDNPVDRNLLIRVSSMNSCKGFPTRAQVVAFMIMPCLKEGWQQGRDEAIQGKPIDRKLLMHVASMNSGKGFPTGEQVAAFMTMPCLKLDWQPGNDVAVQDNLIDRDLLVRIASMNNGKGFPAKAQVAAFMAMPCLRQDWHQGRDEAVAGKPVDRELLMRVASMNAGKGFPTKEQVEAFMTMPCLKEGWQQGSDESVQGKPIDRELLMHIASMNAGKGFPKRAQVAAFIAIPCLKQGWQQGRDGAVQGKPVDRKLLIRIASMNRGKGFPAKGQVEAFMAMSCLRQGWQPDNDEAVHDKPIDQYLLTRIASMNGGKGFPTKEQVKAFLVMPCLKQGWQRGRDAAVQDNPIDRELLMRVASMNTGRGFPTKEQVEAFMTMPCLKEGWQPGCDEAVRDKPIDGELLIHISSMYSSRGFPGREQVAAFMLMPCLKEGWQQGNDKAVQDNPVDRNLLIRIASMNSCKGFPTRAQVAAFMTIPCLKEGWQPGGDEAVQDKPIDRELLARIASMNRGKGFPTKAQVASFMTMPCLKQDWQPGNDEAVEDNPIDCDLLKHIASMNSGKGFPTKAQLEAFMNIPCLRQGWQPGRDEAVQGKPVDRVLLMHIASMNNGKGFPTKAQVEAFMAIPCLIQDWQGCDEVVQDNPVNRKLLAHIASMNNCNGFPTEAQTTAFARWLPQENNSCLKIASRVFHSSGLPEQSVLTANERRLRRYLPDLPEYSIDSGDGISDSDNESDPGRAEDQQMKVLALFCSAPDKWRMNFAEFDQYLTAFTNARHNDRTQVLCALASLMPVLFNHGGAGVRFWLARHNDNTQDRHLLTKALSISASLDTVKIALTQLPESECLAYIVLCAKLSHAPNKAQWDELQPLREQLDQHFTMARSKAMMLEILWSQPEAKRSGYGEKLDSVFDTVPTIRQLYRIHRAFGPQKMQGFLDACIARQTANAESLPVKAQELLMEGLLLAHYHLNDYGHISDLCFSSQVASRNGKGVVINGDAAMPGKRRLWHFITAMLFELEQTPEYQFEKQQLTVWSGSGSVVLPKPEFSLAGSGFVITNWSLEQVQTFFRATEFTEQWYKRLQDLREPYVTRLDERLSRMRARAGKTEKTGNQKAANQKAANQKAANQKRVPPSVILCVIKSGLPLKHAVWTSLEHYANNGQLTDRLCQALAPVIEQQAAIAPDSVKNSVKNAVSARLAEIDAQKIADQATITQPSPLELIPQPPVTGSAMHRPQVTLATAMATLDHFQVLGETELEILQPYRDQMTPIQLASVIDKMCHRIDAVTQLDWFTTYEKKRKDPLGLNELISWSDDERSEWLADILE